MKTVQKKKRLSKMEIIDQAIDRMDDQQFDQYIDHVVKESYRGTGDVVDNLTDQDVYDISEFFIKN